MNNFVKIALRNAFLFAIYQLIFCLIFDVFSFLGNSINLFNAYSLSFLFVFLIHYIIHSVIDKVAAEIGIKRIINSSAFIATSILSSIAIWWVFASSNSVIFILLSAFVIPSFLPAIGYFLISLFNENLAEVEIHTKPIISDNQFVTVEEVISESPKEEVKFILENENGKELLNLSINRIICFEANDNYVVTYYLDKTDKIKKSMERVSLKKIEEILHGLNVVNFSRVHKSYLINRDYVDEIKGKAQAHKVKLFHLEILVPISRTFPINLLKLT